MYRVFFLMVVVFDSASCLHFSPNFIHRHEWSRVRNEGGRLGQGRRLSKEHPVCSYVRYISYITSFLYIFHDISSQAWICVNICTDFTTPFTHVNQTLNVAYDNPSQSMYTIYLVYTLFYLVYIAM